MLYKPTKVAKMWDTWLYYHDGVHYLYYLHETTGARFDGISVATSRDGVHFEEVGSIIEQREDAEWLGTGSTWRVGDQFVMNFSEQRDGVQAVFIAVSDDLLHWRRLGDEYRSDPDPRWYDNTPTGRWDCIWTAPRPDGGFWGYLTARPWSDTPGVRYGSVGKVASDDGLHWHAVEPPVIEWGDWPRMNVGEVGAIEKIGERYYLILGYGETELGHRHAWRQVGPRIGMYTFVGDDPEGPFRADTKAYRLLTSNASGHQHAYFTRFYPSPDGMLVTHHSISRSNVRWMAPLKRAVVDGAGHLSLGYWEGNEVLKGKQIELDLTHPLQIAPGDSEGWDTSDGRLGLNTPHGGGLALLQNHFDLERGTVFEGSMVIEEPAGRWSGIGLYVETDARQNAGTAFLCQTRGCTEIGPLRNMGFLPDDTLQIGVLPGRRCHFRLLVRRFLTELYIDNQLVQCYSLPESVTGRIGLVVESGRGEFSELRAWEMNL